MNYNLPRFFHLDSYYVHLFSQSSQQPPFPTMRPDQDAGQLTDFGRPCWDDRIDRIILGPLVHQRWCLGFIQMLLEQAEQV